jgi:anti-anti-sigma regulatory factor
MITEERLSAAEILIKLRKNVTPAEIQQFSKKIVPSPYKTVIIDLSEMYHLNYIILDKLHLLKLDLAVRSKRLVFQGCSEKLLNTLKLLKFDKTIEILRSSPQKQQTKRERPKGGEKFFPF